MTLLRRASLYLFFMIVTYSPLVHSAIEDDTFLVTVDWLHQRLADPSVVVLDATVEIGRSEEGRLINLSGLPGFEQAHIPGARFADLKDRLSKQPAAFDNVMPEPDHFARELELLGISNDSEIVIYSRQYSVWAARLWWMLKWAGHEKVALLDGGFKAWQDAGFPIATGSSHVSKGHYQLQLNHALIADQQQVHRAIEDQETLLVDATPAAHFAGDFAMYARSGHIPTAINIPTSLVERHDGRFVSSDEVSLLLEQSTDTPIIAYCGGGVAASAIAFNLKRAGFNNVAVYMGSLQEWVIDPNNPMSSDE